MSQTLALFTNSTPKIKKKQTTQKPTLKTLYILTTNTIVAMEATLLGMELQTLAVVFGF